MAGLCNSNSVLGGVYVFDDDAATSITSAPVSGSLVSPGTYATTNNRPGTLSDFNGENTGGTWTLGIADTCNLDAGALRSWWLTFQVGVAPQAYVQPVLGHILGGDTLQLVGSFHDRRFAPVAQPAFGSAFEGDRPFHLWARSGGGWENTSARLDGLFLNDVADIRIRRGFFQAGISAQLAETFGGRVVGSVFGHYSSSSTSVADGTGFGVGSTHLSSGGFGTSVSWLGDSGLYIDALGLASWSDIDVTARTATGKTRATTVAGSLEAGYRIPLTTGINLIPQAQLVLQNVSINDFVDTAGIVTGFPNSTFGTVRAGAEVEYVMEMDAADLGFNASVHLVHGFGDESSAFVDGTMLGFPAPSTGIELGTGISFEDNSKKWKFGVNGNARFAVDSGRSNSYGVNAIASISW